MKTFTTLVLSLICALLCFAGDNGKRYYIIDGYFFEEMPVDSKMTSTMMSIKTSNGTHAFGLIIKEPLTEEIIKRAVPADSVYEAGLLLEQYNEKKSQSLRITSGQAETIKAGDAFPDFKAVDINGREWSNEDTKGKVTVLNSWFTGCGPCRAEMPELSEWKNEMPDVMFFSSTYEKAETARPVLESTGFNWIPLIKDRQFKDYIGSEGYPMTVVVDKNGIIRQVEFGTSAVQRKRLKQTIESLR